MKLLESIKFFIIQEMVGFFFGFMCFILLLVLIVYVGGERRE